MTFNLVQSVAGPTQEHGHTLDLVLSCGLPVFNIDVCNTVFSDHMPVLFDISLSSVILLNHVLQLIVVVCLTLPLLYSYCPPFVLILRNLTILFHLPKHPGYWCSIYNHAFQT